MEESVSKTVKIDVVALLVSEVDFVTKVMSKCCALYIKCNKDGMVLKL